MGCGKEHVGKVIGSASMSVFPTDRVERTVATNSSPGSYTFSFVKDGLEGCAYRDGNNISMYTNRVLEFEAVVINRQYKNDRTVSFTTEAMTPEGCYIIKTFDTR
jgi:hypothetical protein